MAAGVLDKNLTHDASRHSKEMRAVLPLGHIVANQSNIDLVHERCTLQCVIRAFPLQIMVSNLTQFGIDDRHEVIEGLLISASPAHQ